MRLSRETRLFGLLLLLVLFSAGCSRRARVIPEDTMTRIYADMLLRDQWISGNTASRRTADTTLVYDDIFAKYGYNYASYEKSVRYYVSKPDKYEKLLEATTKRLERYAKRLERIDKAWKERFVPAPMERCDFAALLPMLIDSLFLPAPVSDSLRCCDSLCRWHCCDSCCCRPDSLAAVDTVAVDTLFVKEDSIRTIINGKERTTEKVLLPDGPYNPQG